MEELKSEGVESSALSGAEEEGEVYYKMVAKINGCYYSIYDARK